MIEFALKLVKLFLETLATLVKSIICLGHKNAAEEEQPEPHEERRIVLVEYSEPPVRQNEVSYMQNHAETKGKFTKLASRRTARFLSIDTSFYTKVLTPLNRN